MNVEVLPTRNLDGELIPGGSVFLYISYFAVINIEDFAIPEYLLCFAVYAFQDISRECLG
jgi:hypothetical protein